MTKNRRFREQCGYLGRENEQNQTFKPSSFAAQTKPLRVQTINEKSLFGAIFLFLFAYMQKKVYLCTKFAIRHMKEISTKKLLETIIEGVRNRKGQRIVTIDLRKIKEAPVEYMLICEGQSNTQVAAIADEIDDFVRTTTHVHPLSVAGQENAEWIAMDYGTIFVHVMQREPRAFYDIEHLWADGKVTELPEVL